MFTITGFTTHKTVNHMEFTTDRTVITVTSLTTHRTVFTVKGFNTERTLAYRILSPCSPVFWVPLPHIGVNVGN